MTTFERFERAIPELMTELAPARVPDYLDDMLRETAKHGQRPAWSYPERWLPMDIAIQPLASRRFPWRPLLVAGLIGLLIAAGLAAYIGSQQRLPPPFGLARNGQILFSTPDGNIVSADPETGVITALITGPELASNPWFSNDGTRFAFDRRTAGSPPGLFVANADGTNVRQVADPAPEISWFDWSPTGDRFALSRAGDPPGQVTIMDSSDGSTTTFQLGLEIATAAWRPNSDQLVVTTNMPGGSAAQGFYLVGSDGTGLKPIVVGPTIINTPTVSPDGSMLAYATWETGAEGRIHVVDIDSGVASGVDFAPDFEFNDLSPVFSPDGKTFIVHRSAIDGYRLTALSVDGQARAVPMGLAHPDMTDGAAVLFSPDGTKVLATYRNDATTWLLDVVTGGGDQMTWSVPMATSATWQRLAP